MVLELTETQQKILKWTQSNALVAIVLLFALAACIITINSSQEYAATCNAHWQKQMQQCNCACLQQQPQDFIQPFKLEVPYGNQDKNKDT